MIAVMETKTGVYHVQITGKDIKLLAKMAKQSKKSRQEIIGGCLRFGIAFLLYLFED